MAVKAKAIKENKKKAVKEIKEKIDLSKIIILTDYRGMSVKQVTDLRRKLRETKAEYRVYKNTMVVKALPEGFAGLTEKLKGPIAIVFGFDEITTPAKALVKFITDNEKPALIAGVIENQVCADKQIKELAKLPSRKELLAKVVGGLQSPLYGLVNVSIGPIRKLVYALNAIKEKKQGGEK